MVDCCWLKTRSIVFDQVDDGGSFGGVFVSSGVILAPFVVFFSHGRSIRVVRRNFFIAGADDVQTWRRVGSRREGVSHRCVTLPSPQETWS